jgi:DNA-binding response OmpR family regulator
MNGRNRAFIFGSSRIRDHGAMRVLIVEDELRMASLIRRGLMSEGLSADIAVNGEDALWMAEARDYDALVLDVMLPGIDGFETCRRLRNNGVWVPVLMLTARDSVDDRVAGLDTGADDYLVKPFAFAELLARIRALMRRGRSSETPRLAVGDLSMDLITRKVLRAGQPVELTVREFELLEYLMRYEGQVVSRETLARDVWKETSRTTPLDNVIDVHIARLRRKVDVDRPVKLIHTVRGVGFMLREGEP